MTIDITPPQLVSLSLPEVIDLGDGRVSATFSVTATDNLGVNRAVIWFESPVGYGFSQTSTPGNWSLLIVDGNWVNDQASVTRYFAPDHRANTPGTVSIDRVVVEDLSGNSVTYRAGELADMGLPTSFEMIGGEPDNSPPQLVSLSLPEVIDLGDGIVSATFSVTATDNLGVNQVAIWFESPVGYGFSQTSTPDNWSLLIVDGNWVNDQASVTRYFAPDHSANAPRTVSIDRVVVEDLSGNSVTYRAGELADMGLRTSFEIRQDGALEEDLAFRANRSGDSLVVQIINEGEELSSPQLSGQIAFILQGASYVSASAVGTSALQSSVSQVGGSLQVNFSASLAGERPFGSPLIEVSFNLAGSGSLEIASQSITIDGRSVNVGTLERVKFEALPTFVARDDSVEAVEDDPEVTGNVLDNDIGDGLAVVAVAGDANNLSMPIVGEFGTLTLTADGRFSYLADNATRLPEGAAAQDVFAYEVTDSSAARESAQLVVVVTGVNDPASITGDTTGLVVEDDADRQQASGVLTVIDPDAGEDRFREIEATALRGVFGSFTFDAGTGVWSYDLGSEVVLSHNTVFMDTLTVTSLDGSAIETIAVTISGMKDDDEAGIPPGSGTPGPTIITVSIADRNGRDMEVVALSDGNRSDLAISDTEGVATFEILPGTEVAGNAFLEFTAVRPITAQDALEALRLAVGLHPTYGEADPYAFIAADFNQDGRVTAQDALEILRNAVRLPDAIQTEWIFVDSDQDLSHIDRRNVTFEQGFRIEPDSALFTDASPTISLTGILLGDVNASYVSEINGYF